MESKIDDPLTFKIIGCAQKVHSILGNGFQEFIYQTKSFYLDNTSFSRLKQFSE